MEYTISNVPKKSIVSESGLVEVLTEEHIFDTVFLIDPSVSEVTYLGDGVYKVRCGNKDGRVQEVLDKKLIGNNLITVTTAENHSFSGFYIAFFAILALVVFMM
jgi:hypothetical protein